ncbi:MAG: hypothetical protein LBT98_01110, partial [Puniceicoccales bacterium]|nr:hypothetical protein [Puniceicoccales bacterium]
DKDGGEVAGPSNAATELPKLFGTATAAATPDKEIHQSTGGADLSNSISGRADYRLPSLQNVTQGAAVGRNGALIQNMLKDVNSLKEQLNEHINSGTKIAPGFEATRARPSCGQVLEFLDKLEANIPSLGDQSAEHLGEFNKLFQSWFQSPLDCARFIGADFEVVDAGAGNGRLKPNYRMPLLDFIQGVKNGPDHWNQSMEWLKMDQKGYVGEKPSQDMSRFCDKFARLVAPKKSDESAFWRQDGVNVFANSGLPLGDVLETALLNLADGMQAVLPESRNKNYSIMWKIYGTFDGAAQGILDDLRNARSADLPPGKDDVIDIYNRHLEELVQNLNGQFQENGYDGIDFDDIRIHSEGEGDRLPDLF